MAQSKGISHAQVIAALKATRGLKSMAAGKLGITRQTIQNRVNRNADLQLLIKELREHTGDIAESNVAKAIDAGDFQASRFYLETQCKDRGYGKSVNATVSIADEQLIALVGAFGGDPAKLRAFRDALDPAASGE
jgi:hypothetical protein